MNPKDLPSLAVMQAFLSVVDCGGVVPAEKRGRGHRGNLHRSVVELTDLVGTPLVESKGGFHVHRAGREVADGIVTGLKHIAHVIGKVRNEARPGLTLVSSAMVAEFFLTELTQTLECGNPNLCCSTDSGHEPELRQMLRDGEAAVAIAADHPGWRGFGRARLLDVRPLLVAPRTWRGCDASALFAQEVVKENLFYSAASDTLRLNFDAGLDQLGTKWPNRRRVASMPAVLSAVAQGRGFGLGVDVPAVVQRPGLVFVPTKFDPFPICAFWRGQLTPEIRVALTAMRRLASRVRDGRARAKSGRSC